MSKQVLFDLVKSLTKEEIRLFRKQESNKKSDAVRLYDILSNQEDYDVSVVKKKFKKDNQLAVTRNILLNKILDCLRLASGQASESIELQEELIVLQIILHKKIYSLFERKMKAALKKAYAQERFLLLLQLLNLKQKYLVDLKDDKMRPTLLDLQKEKRKVILLFQEYYALKDLQDEVIVFFKRSSNLAYKEVAKRLDNNVLLTEDNIPKSFRSQCIYYDLMAYHAFCKGEYLQRHAYYKTVVELWEQHPAFWEQEPMKYVKAICGLLNSCFRTRKIATYPVFLKRLEDIAQAYPEIRSEMYATTCYHKTIYALLSRNFESYVQCIPEEEEKIALAIQAGIHSSRLLTIYHNISLVYFITERFEETIDYILKIEAYKKTEAREDSRYFIPVLRILCEYELDNHFWLNNYIKTLRTRYRRHEKLNALEKIVFTHISKLLNTTSKQEERTILGTFWEEIKELKENDSAKATNYMDIVWCWLRSRFLEGSIGDAFGILMEEG